MLANSPLTRGKRVTLGPGYSRCEIELVKIGVTLSCVVVYISPSCVPSRQPNIDDDSSRRTKMVNSKTSVLGALARWNLEKPIDSSPPAASWLRKFTVQPPDTRKQGSTARDSQEVID